MHSGISASNFSFYDLNRKVKSRDPNLIFEGWQPENERIAILSPHDDDALLGAGYLLLYTLSAGAQAHIVIFCNGCGGYSRPDQKDEIVEIRKAESLNAYQKLGLNEANIARFDYPDFSLRGFIGLFLPKNEEGTTLRTLYALRKIKPTRMIIPNEYREHLDHEAASCIGAYDGPQVGDPVLVDIGEPFRIRSYLKYSIWGDFSPEDSLVNNRPVNLRGNIAIVADEEVEKRIQASVMEFKSQKEIIRGLVKEREERKVKGRYLELYLKFDPRPRLAYEPYKKIIEKIDKPSNY